MDFSLIEKDKILLRAGLEDMVHGLSDEARREKSRAIMEKVLGLPAFENASRIFIYLPLRAEVQTRDLIEKCFSSDKQVYVPLITGSKGVMEAARIKDLENGLRRGSHGLLEPSEPLSVRKDPSQFDLMIIPGLGFDREGGRIGRGLGYFDRFLSKARGGLKVGVCFREQLVSRIPMEPHDIYMDVVIYD